MSPCRLKFEGGQLSNRYLHGPVVDQILADEQVSSLSTPGAILWPLTDNLGTVRDVAEYNSGTDVTTIANHIVYDAFGQRTSETNSAVNHLFGYTGRDWDADVELQYNRARWFDPATGKWLSQDPIGFSAWDSNLYRYVANGPVVAIDPTGLRMIYNMQDGEKEGIPLAKDKAKGLAQKIWEQFKNSETYQECLDFLKEHKPRLPWQPKAGDSPWHPPLLPEKEGPRFPRLPKFVPIWKPERWDNPFIPKEWGGTSNGSFE